MGSQRADQSTIRRANLALVLGHLRAHGTRSRARIATGTGLNKATVSSLVAELLARGLAREGAIQRAGSVGRPGQAVELDGRGVWGLGVELSVDYVAVLALDLRDEVRWDARVALDVPAQVPERTLDVAAGLVRAALDAAARADAVAVGVTVVLPGLVSSTSGVLAVAPNLGWRGTATVEELAQRLGEAHLPIAVENDANLSALAEHALGPEAGTPDLVCLTGDVGVGAGIVVGGRLVRGSEGFAGEVGHMCLDPHGEVCGCGRRGCWETLVGLRALLRAAGLPEDASDEPRRDLRARVAEVRARAEAGDEVACAALADVGTALGRGASLIVNLVNPRVVVLGGYFAGLGDWLLPPMLAELDARVIAPQAGGVRVVCSRLGFRSAIRGGARVALERVLLDPTRVGCHDQQRQPASGQTVR